MVTEDLFAIEVIEEELEIEVHTDSEVDIPSIGIPGPAGPGAELRLTDGKLQWRPVRKDNAAPWSDLVDMSAYLAGTEGAAAAARRWATEAENAEIEPGLYSALHHALKAAASALGAGLSEAASLSAAGDAADARDAALAYRNTALTAKNEAATAKTGAETARSGAENARDTAQTARTGAENARDASVAAQSAAETAKGLAETARTNAGNAQTAAEAARDAAVTAKNNAESAAGTATTQAGTATSAAGTATGAAVAASGYADAAAGSAASASGSAGTASGAVSSAIAARDKAEQWAEGTGIVESGKYSAKHHAAIAEAAAIAAASITPSNYYTKTEADGRYATAAQGSLADSAVQPGALGNSAGRNVGTGTGTVAAGDDSRITGAAQKAQNLNDLVNKVTAFANIKQNATQSATGVVQLATDAEMATGTATNRVPSVKQVADALSGGSGGWDLIGEYTLSGSAVTINGIPNGYKYLVVVFDNGYSSQARSISLSSDNGASFGSALNTQNYNPPTVVAFVHHVSTLGSTKMIVSFGQTSANGGSTTISVDNTTTGVINALRIGGLSMSGTVKLYGGK